MQMPKKEYLIPIIALALGFVAGYQFMPTKVEVREKIVEKKVTDTEKKTDKEYVKVTEKRPDGTTVTRTEVKTKTDEHKRINEERETERSKIVERSRLVHFQFIGARGFNTTSSTTYGISLSRSILGPFTLGGIGLMNSSTRELLGGITLGIQL